MTSLAVGVRLAEAPDADGIAAAHVEGWRAAYVGLVPKAVLDGLSVERRREMWADRISEPGETRTWVAHLGDRIVGFAGTARPSDPALPENTAELESIYLLPDLWHTGTGRKLMRLAVDDLAARGFKRAILWVFTDNERARRFYEAAGWSPDGAVQMLDFSGLPIEEIRYRRELDQPKVPASEGTVGASDRAVR